MVTDIPGTDEDIDKWLERIEEKKEEKKAAKKRLEKQRVENTFIGKDLILGHKIVMGKRLTVSPFAYLTVGCTVFFFWIRAINSLLLSMLFFNSCSSTL